MITPTFRLRVQHSLTPGAKALRLPVPSDTTFEELAAMVAQRLALKHANLQFASEDGDALSGMDRVGELLDDGETVVATLAQPILETILERSGGRGPLYAGTVAPVAEPEPMTEAPGALEVVEGSQESPEDEEEEDVASLEVLVHRVAKPKAEPGEAAQDSRVLTVAVPEAAFGALIGQKGSNLKRLQKKHSVKLTLDRQTAGTGKGRCEIKGASAAAARAGEAAVQEILRAVEADEKHRAQEAQRKAIRRLPLEEAQEALSTQKRIKALRGKLRKIEQTKKQLARGEHWVESTQLAQLKSEPAYLEELEELCQHERLPVQQLKGRLAQKSTERNDTAVAKEYQWDGKGAVMELVSRDGKVMGRTRRE